jgi:hypothetical protein
MESSFEAQLRDVTARVSEQLVQEIVQVIFARLGFASGAPAAFRAAVRSSAGHAPKHVSKPGKVSAVKPAAKSKGGRKKGDKPLDGRRQRLLSVISSSKGMSLGELQRSTGFPRTFVRRALKEFRGAGRVYMAGDRGLARYGTSQAVAQQAYVAARIAQRKDGGSDRSE